jgi:signal transduction histidine kinase
VESDRVSRGARERFEIASIGPGGRSLGEHLPDLHVIFSAASGIQASSPPPLPLSRLWLWLVVPLTLLGGLLLWRDTRRESRTAEMRSQFVSSVSHELKTPLTSIRMFAETLQMADETHASDPQIRAEYLDTIVSEAERLTRLLNNVLDFSRIERDQKTYHLESAHLANVVDAAVRTMRFPLAEQGFRLDVNVSRELPPLQIDRDAMEQAILNLLSNAMKYSGKSRDIALRVNRQNGSAVIQVSDHGIGIPAAEQRRIFDRFYRVPSKENRSISGTGLGLALVAHVAEAHGGTVDVLSEPGAGSTFSIKIPVNGSNGA